MATVSSLHFLLSKHESTLTARIAGFEDAVEQIGNGLIDFLIDLEGVAGPGPRLERRQAVWLQAQLRGQLNQLGYTQLAEKFVSHYDESQLFAQQVLKLLGHPSQMLIPLRDDTLQNLRQLDLSAFEELGNHGIRALSREVAMNAIVGTKRSQVIKNLKQTLDSQFVKSAEKYADTALRTFDRTSNFELWNAAGITKYRYWGPNDSDTRPFCAAHVGKIYSLAEIKAMSNGTILSNVMVSGGGFRCRHSWIPVPEIDVQHHEPSDPTDSWPPYDPNE